MLRVMTRITDFLGAVLQTVMEWNGGVHLEVNAPVWVLSMVVSVEEKSASV